MAKTPFKAEIRPSGRGGGGHLVEVPDEIVVALGGKGRIPVAASFNGVPYRGSIVKMGGVMMLGVTKAIMTKAGVGPGDVLDVVVENDDAPREVETPPELAKALRKNRPRRPYGSSSRTATAGSTWASSSRRGRRRPAPGGSIRRSGHWSSAPSEPLRPPGGS